MGKKFDYDKMEIKIVASKKELSFEEQLKRVEKINDTFVDIAVKYHTEKIKTKKI